MKKYIFEIITFILIILLLTIMAITNGFFGEESHLILDGIAQYHPFLKTFYQIIKDGSSLFYNETYGLGINFLMLYYYYLASPFNFLVPLFNNIEHFMLSITIIKIALAGSVFVYYLKTKYQSTSLLLVIFGLLYAFSGYFMAFRTNIMWLDSIIFFPLLLLGIDRLLKENKLIDRSLIIFGGLSIIFNYYMGIVILISVTVYFLISILINKIFNFQILKKFAINMALIVALSAVVIIPTYLYLFNYYGLESINLASNFDLFNYNLTNTNIIKYLFFEPNLNSQIGIRNIFIGLPILLILLASIFYNIEKKQLSKEEIILVIMAILIVLASIFSAIDFVFSGFFEVRGFFHRYSFVIIFSFLVLSYQSLIKKDLQPIHYSLAFLSMLILAYYLADLNINYLIWGLLFTIIFSYYKKYQYLLLIMLFLTIIYTNDSIKKSFYLNKSVSQEQTIIEESGITNLYESIQFQKFSYNLSTGQSPNYYSSTINNKLAENLQFFGFHKETNGYFYQRINPISDMFLNIKYHQFNRSIAGELYIIKETNFYQTNYLFNQGFFTTKIAEKPQKSKMIDNLNDFVYQLTKISNIYEKIHYEESEIVKIELKEAGYYFIEYQKVAPHQTLSIKMDNSHLFTNDYFVFLNYCSGNCQLEILVKPSREKAPPIKIFKLNYQKMQTVYQKLSDFNILEFQDQSHQKKIIIETSEGGYYYLPVTYDPSWQIYLNGKKINPHNVFDVFLAIELDEGINEIELKYLVQGFYSSLMISLSTIIFLIIYPRNKK